MIITRKTIWATTYLDTTGDSTADSLVFEGTSTTIYVGSSVYVNSGDTRKGKTYHWDGTNWIASQEKTKVNQYPLFELYDSNGVISLLKKYSCLAEALKRLVFFIP